MELTLDQALQKGVEAHKAGKAQEADQYYTAILKANPKHPDANHNMGVLAVGLGKVETALPFFKTALEANPNIAQFWLSYIDALIKLERLAEAKTVFDQAKSNGAAGKGFDQLEKRLASSPSITSNTQEPSQEQLNSLVNLYTHGQYKEALTQASQLLKNFPNDINLYNISGAANQRLGNLEEAVEAYNKAISLKPDYADAYYNLGNALKEQGKLEDAIKAYKKAITLNPKYAEAYNNMGNALHDQNKITEAVEAYSKATSLKPNYAEAYYNLGTALREKGKLNEAIETYNEAISINPEYAEAYFNLGNALKEQGKLELAVEAYNKAILRKSDSADAYLNLGNALQKLGKLEEATETYTRTLALEPNYAEAHYNMGTALQEQGKLDEAIDAFNKAISIKPDYAEALNNLGVTLQEQGKLDEATETYCKALSIKPEHTATAANLVKLPVGSLKLKHLTLCEIFKRSPRTFTNKSKYIFFKANMHKHKGEYDKAFNEFCKANEIKLGEMAASRVKDKQKNKRTIENLKKWEPKKNLKASDSLIKLLFFAPSRSGKSTLEYLLKQSSQVLPLYEAIKLKHLKPNAIRKFEDIFYQNEGELLEKGYKVVTSTAPSSIFYSDRLMDVLPKTYFIFLERDEMDVAAEIFTREYTNENFYSYDPIQITKYLRDYYEICKILKEKVPNRVKTITYDELTERPQDVIEHIETLVSQNFKIKNISQVLPKHGSEKLFRNHFTQLVTR